MSDKPNTNIPLDFDAEAAVGALEGYDDHTAAMMGTTQTAVSQMGAAIAKTIDARKFAESNGAWNKTAKTVQTHVLAEKLYNNCITATMKARAGLERTAEAMEKDLNAPIQSNASHQTSSEIRAHMKGLKDGERMKLLNQAMADSDELTMSSILGARHYLSGLSAEMHAAMSADWHRRSKPDVVKRLTLAKAADEMLRKRLSSLEKHLWKAVGVSRAEAVVMRERQRDAEAAFKIADA